jgi:hypothetical protein
LPVEVGKEVGKGVEVIVGLRVFVEIIVDVVLLIGVTCDSSRDVGVSIPTQAVRPIII